MKKLVVILIIAFATVVSKKAVAQYDGAIGLRLGIPVGITYKGFFSKRTALEIIGTFYSRNNYTSIGITGLLEFHAELADNFYFLYGFGAHAASGPQIGIDGILGLTYIADAVPLEFSLDWKPAFNLVAGDEYRGILPAQFALSIRYHW